MSIVAIIKKAFISVIVYSNKRVIISAHFNVVLIIEFGKALKLSNNRDLLFKL